MKNSLKDKVAVITGGNSGIGFATAKLFISEGSKVFITGRDQKSLDVALSELGPNARGQVSDAGDIAAVTELASTLKKTYSHIDTLFLNAGIAKFSPLESSDEVTFDEIFDTNVKGPYFLIQQLLPVLGKGSSIVINASINAHIGMAGTSIYGASKAAVLSFIRTLSADLLPRGVRVNAVSPGPVTTPIIGRMGLPEVAVDAIKAGLVTQIPLQRFGLPEEIARTVLFLGTDQSSFIVGTEIVADGGMSQL